MAGTIRVGIVGAGGAARFHFDDYQRVYNVPVEVVGVMSRSAETTQAFARERGIKAYATFEELCDAVDVVDVCTPSATHEAMTVEAFARGKDVVIEKPLTGYFGPVAGDFRGDTFSKEVMLREAVASSERMLAAARKAGKRICYAENWVYAPAIQKEREILTKSGGQVLRIMADESHSGSASVYGGIWRHSGGGALVGKGCHPLSAALYLKRAEGQARGAEAIRPAKVSAHVGEITRLKNYRDEGFLRTSYEDVEDYCQTHVTFDDGTVADIFCSDLVLGGVHSWMEVFANNHRTRCNLNPVNALETYNPREDLLKDVFVTSRIGTKQGWSNPSADFDWQQGYPQEFQDFMESIALHREPLSGGELARDTVAVLYSAYLSAERHGVDVEISR
jgi:predicted dehydrogenase